MSCVYRHLEILNLDYVSSCNTGMWLQVLSGLSSPLDYAGSDLLMILYLFKMPRVGRGHAWKFTYAVIAHFLLRKHNHGAH